MRNLDANDQSLLARREQIEGPVDPQRYTTLRRLIARDDHRLVVSLGGGSAPALAGNIALLSILEELDLQQHVQQVWGTSAGAIIGGPWASGTKAQQMMHDVLAAQGQWDLRWLHLGLAFLLHPFGWPLPEGLIGGRGFAALIQRSLKVERFDQCAIPFRCIAASTDGQPRPVVLSEGPRLPAILASMCVPGVFEPQSNGFSDCCDGGIVEKTPLRSPIGEHLRSGDTRTLLLLATHFGVHGRRAASRDFIHRFLYGVDAMEEIAWPCQLQEARNYPRVVPLVLDPRIVASRPFDLRRLQLHYWTAREFFVQRLQNPHLALAFGAE
ncbi:MAG: patatin-like phospholipase family protein [Phycisphaerales bacterium]|nr:patatin-like phospholipase family protein [Phycisphaerales bacterium]